MKRMKRIKRKSKKAKTSARWYSVYEHGRKWVVAVIYGDSSNEPVVIGRYATERNAAFAAYRHERTSRRKRVSARQILARVRRRAAEEAVKRDYADRLREAIGWWTNARVETIDIAL